MISKVYSLVVMLALLFGVSSARADQDVFDNVIKTGTIRCGYPIWPPILSVDPNTKKISGAAYDFVNAIGQKLNLKIDWAEETGWGVAEQGIKSGRYDMVCGPVCLDSARSRNIWFSEPFSITPNFVFARADDMRFDRNLSKINNSSVKIAVIPNTMQDYIARDHFPLAQRFDVTDLAGEVDVAMAVATGKADVGFNIMTSIDKFNRNQKQKLKAIGNEPIHNCYGALMLPQGDTRFKYMIDTAIHELSATGQLEKIISPYFPNDKKYWRSPSYPYQPTP